MPITTESKRGSDLSGTDGATSRVLTLSNTSLTQSGGFLVFVNGLSLVVITEFTVHHLSASSTVTFLNPTFNTDYIVVEYIQGASTPGVPRYCTYTDVYNRTGLSSSEVSTPVMETLIVDAEAEVDMLTGRRFDSGNSFTDFISVKRKDIIDNYQTTFLVSHWPVQSVTICELLDIDGNATATFDTLSSSEISSGIYDNDDYWLEVQNDTATNSLVPNGKFVLKTNSISEGTNIIKVAYTYGYGAVPQVVVNLASCLSGMRAWIYFAGGQYNRITSYAIPQQSVTKGDLYARAMQNVSWLKEQAEQLLDRIGKKSRTFFFATGSER